MNPSLSQMSHALEETVDYRQLLRPEVVARLEEWAILTVEEREQRMIASQGLCEDCKARAVYYSGLCENCYHKAKKALTLSRRENRLDDYSGEAVNAASPFLLAE